MYQKQAKEVLLARPYGTEFAKQIGECANKHFPEESPAMGCMISTLAAQTVIVSVIVSMFEPGSQAGQKVIEEIYDAAKRDAIDRWHQDDLKHNFRSHGGSQ